MSDLGQQAAPDAEPARREGVHHVHCPQTGLRVQPRLQLQRWAQGVPPARLYGDPRPGLGTPSAWPLVTFAIT